MRDSWTTSKLEFIHGFEDSQRKASDIKKRCWLKNKMIITFYATVCEARRFRYFQDLENFKISMDPKIFKINGLQAKLMFFINDHQGILIETKSRRSLCQMWARQGLNVKIIKIFPGGRENHLLEWFLDQKWILWTFIKQISDHKSCLLWNR